MNVNAPSPTVENAIAFANCVLLFGWSCPQANPRYVVITDIRGVSVQSNVTQFRTYSRPDVRNAFELEAGGTDEFGFVAAIDVVDLVGLRIYDGDIHIAVENADKSVATGKIQLLRCHLDSDEETSTALGLLDLAANLELIDSRLVEFFRHGRNEAATAPIKYGIDVAGRSNSGFMVEGWIENARSQPFAFMSNDGLTFIPTNEVIYKGRPDVSDHLRTEKRPVSTEDHGVVLNFPYSCGDTDGFVVMSDEGSRFVPLVRIKTTFGNVQRSSDPDCVVRVRRGAVAATGAGAAIYLPFFVDLKRADQFSIQWIKQTETRPKLSIIVPLFREYRFIFSLMTMQKWFPTDWEWLFISDDPTQHAILSQILERRSDSLHCPTALIINRFNYGFAKSNNIGASFARGKVLLFMNSDIWINDPAPIAKATKMIKAGQYQVLGFRLLYEDGTLQHDGMSFRRSGLMHNLFLVDHPYKGTPPANGPEKVVDVPAVTGALLMISKEWFAKIGKFDRAYIKGDFEDADLCLKVRHLNGRVGLYQTDGIYHLERQSIRLMDGESTRMALTYLNCITFNERWGNVIASLKEKDGEATMHPAARTRQQQKA